MKRIILLICLSICGWTLSAQSNWRYRPDTLASGLEIPWDIDFSPDGRIFITERPGRIRVINEKGELLQDPWAVLDVANWQAAGLSGLAISPDFASDRYIYVMGTFRTESGYANRIFRFRDQGNRGIEMTQIIPDLPSINTHSGGALDFGPDGYLYVGLGDNEDIALVQEIDNLTGKILRYKPTGDIPNDNPYTGNPLWALGLRNPQGFAWDRSNGDMFSTEHGPSGFKAEGYREHQDELNFILKNGNYGWPIVSGMHMDKRFMNPIVEWTPAIAPSGLTIINDDRSPWFGQLIVGALRGQELRRIAIEKSDVSYTIIDEKAMFTNDFGRIRCVEEGPDGNIYFGTSNIDTPGEPKRRLNRPGDDHVYVLKLIQEND